jgi:hypothetical protein
MIRWAIVTLLAMLSACEESQIAACARGCESGGGHMVSYSLQTGCVCGRKP